MEGGIFWMYLWKLGEDFMIWCNTWEILWAAANILCPLSIFSFTASIPTAETVHTDSTIMNVYEWLKFSLSKSPGLFVDKVTLGHTPHLHKSHCSGVDNVTLKEFHLHGSFWWIFSHKQYFFNYNLYVLFKEKFRVWL